MSEVIRYDMSGYGDGMIERPDGAFVYIDDHQSELAALREELAALREELARKREALTDAECELAAAEHRNAELTGLLSDTKTVLGNELSYELFHKLNEHMKRIDAALKPTESGASE